LGFATVEIAPFYDTGLLGDLLHGRFGGAGGDASVHQ
jgi:hypothetical protein